MQITESARHLLLNSYVGYDRLARTPGDFENSDLTTSCSDQDLLSARYVLHMNSHAIVRCTGEYIMTLHTLSMDWLHGRNQKV